VRGHRRAASTRRSPRLCTEELAAPVSHRRPANHRAAGAGRPHAVVLEARVRIATVLVLLEEA
jgi:hypothetical protein